MSYKSNDPNGLYVMWSKCLYIVINSTQIRNGFQTNEALRKELNGRINDLEKQNQELQIQLNIRQHGGASDSLADMRKQV